MKKSVLFLVVLFYVASVFAQNDVRFEYDAAGNRVKRTLVVATRSLEADEQPEEMITEEIAKIGVKIYSSIQGQITIEFSTLDGMKTGTMSVYSSLENGKLVLVQKVQNLIEHVDISKQAGGIYILLVNIDGEQTTFKITKP